MEPSLRLVTDTITFSADHLPRFNLISIAGAHFRDAGATAVQEAAFTLSDGIVYVNRALQRGMPVDQFGPRLSFSFYTYTDIFEQDHRAVKRILHPMLKFESFRTMLTNRSLPCLLSHIAAQPVWQREAK